VNGDGLAQIGQRIKRGKFRLGRVAGDGVAILGRDGNAAAEPKVEPDGAVAADEVGKGRSTALLEPLAAHIGKLVRAGPALFADDTPVKMQAKPSGAKIICSRDQKVAAMPLPSPTRSSKPAA